MKKSLLFISLLVITLLAACGGGETQGVGTVDEETGNTVLTVGASSTPHAEILNQAAPLLEEQGITLQVEAYQDYVLPNDDLANGNLDANYFQHIPFLRDAINTTGYDLTYIDGIHIEPMGVYSKNISSIEEIPEGTEVIMSRSIPDHGRILSLFEQQGLITLDENVEKSTATIDDIVENPLNLQFSADVDPAFLPDMYESEENALVAINTNYAIDAGLNPLEDALFIEDETSDYVNVMAVRSGTEDNEALNTLVDVLQSEEIQNFIVENYNGAVVPVGGEN